MTKTVDLYAARRLEPANDPAWGEEHELVHPAVWDRRVHADPVEGKELLYAVAFMVLVVAVAVFH